MTAGLLTVPEVAKALRVSRMSVYRLLESGELGHIKVGRSFRIPYGALDQFIERNTRQAVLRPIRSTA